MAMSLDFEPLLIQELENFFLGEANADLFLLIWEADPSAYLSLLLLNALLPAKANKRLGQDNLLIAFVVLSQGQSSCIATQHWFYQSTDFLILLISLKLFIAEDLVRVLLVAPTVPVSKELQCGCALMILKWLQVLQRVKGLQVAVRFLIGHLIRLGRGEDYLLGCFPCWIIIPKRNIRVLKFELADIQGFLLIHELLHWRLGLLFIYNNKVIDIVVVYALEAFLGRQVSLSQVLVIYLCLVGMRVWWHFWRFGAMILLIFGRSDSPFQIELLASFNLETSLLSDFQGGEQVALGPRLHGLRVRIFVDNIADASELILLGGHN